MTVCVNCKHHIGMEQGSVRADVWYNQLCKASPLPEIVNPVTGKKETMSGHKYAYCRDINMGHCDKFLDKAPRLIDKILFRKF